MGGAFFMVALDEATLRAACTAGYAAIAAPGLSAAAGGGAAGLARVVARAKFEVALELLEVPGVEPV